MDIVYPLKGSGESYDELAYSLRSLRNLPHDRVFIVGGLPVWAENVHHIASRQLSTKYKDAASNIRAACESPEVSDPFILMNDDFFIMQPIDDIPTLNRGRVRDVEQLYSETFGYSKYLSGMRSTRVALENLGYKDPLSFELHVPMIMRKELRLEVIEMGKRVPVWHARTAYGALAGLTGDTVDDVKVYALDELADGDSPFISTSNESFHRGLIGAQIKSQFPEKCFYERGGCDGYSRHPS